MVARMIRLWILSGVVALAGCASLNNTDKRPVSQPDVTLLAGLSQQVGALKARASAGDHQAEEALLSTVSGQG